MSFIVKFLPRKILSRWVGRFARIQWPEPINAGLLRGFVWLYNINMKEAEKPIEQYSSLMELFTRKLNPSARPIAAGALVHPCDSQIFQRGQIDHNLLIQAKGRKYKLEMLTNDPKVLEKFENGYFITYYLCPTDYHRVHAPADGVITKAIYSAGDLWPVNNWSVKNIKNLYCKNERVYVEMATPSGPIGFVFVGATNVGSIVLNFEPSLKTNKNRGPETKIYAPAVEMNKGDDLGHFRFGSTVVAIYGAEYTKKLKELKLSSFVKVGQELLSKV